MTDSLPTVTSRPHDVARDLYENAIAGHISVDNAISALEKHLCSTTGEGRRYQQLSRWLEHLQTME